MIPAEHATRIRAALEYEAQWTVRKRMVADALAALDALEAAATEREEAVSERIAAELGWDGATTALERAGTTASQSSSVVPRAPTGATPGFDMKPPRIAVDGLGYYWRVYPTHWSMCPVNPDNNPIPEPVTYYERIEP